MSDINKKSYQLSMIKSKKKRIEIVLKPKKNIRLDFQTSRYGQYYILKAAAYCFFFLFFVYQNVQNVIPSIIKTIDNYLYKNTTRKFDVSIVEHFN